MIKPIIIYYIANIIETENEKKWQNKRSDNTIPVLQSGAVKLWTFSTDIWNSFVSLTKPSCSTNNMNGGNVLIDVSGTWVKTVESTAHWIDKNVFQLPIAELQSFLKVQYHRYELFHQCAVLCLLQKYMYILIIQIYLVNDASSNRGPSSSWSYDS
jgi:hypothetical protein